MRPQTRYAAAPATTFKLIYLTGPQIPPIRSFSLCKIRFVNHFRFHITDIVYRVVKPGRDNTNDYIVRGCVHIDDRSTDHVHNYYLVRCSASIASNYCGSVLHSARL
ncbi:hypothetical protein LTR56_008372 [Elasticomyces elasticus]|nr:hypothetical protein LTR56_008372 [Elasticomyces elasticus]KAK5756929.1 hypothetical protein LTS12_013008 [Elasticomyces elasticus]